MKSAIKWGATLSLIGGVLMGTLLVNTQYVLALTDEQVTARLRPVPVFTITDQQGAPLVSAPPQGQQGPPVAGVFISQQDAQTFLNNLRQTNPQVAQGVQVVPVSLAEVYNLARQSESQPEPLKFAFVPMQQQVQSALALLQQEGQSVEQFNGVPLFIARATSQEGGYLTIQQGDQQVIPMFFKREELQAMLDRLQREQPTLAAQMNIQVVNLENLIQTLQSSDNQELTQILLVPPSESIEYVRSLQPAQGQQPASSGTPAPATPAPATPAPAPATPATPAPAMP
jgi:hypothetical protein